MHRDYKPATALEQIADRVRGARSRNQPSAIGACVFAGGFSFGVEQAGFRVAGHLELTDLDLGARTASQRWPVVLAPLDASYHTPGAWFPQDPTTWKSAVQFLKQNDAVPDLLYMNPPCSAYAKQGRRQGLDDTVMCYTRYCVDLGLELEPTVWMWELVEGIYDRDLPFLELIAERAVRKGYRCYAFLTSAALHGGYQNRVRFHFVASKVELDFEATYEEEPAERKGWRTLGDALDALAREIAASKEPVVNHEEERDSGGALLDIVPFCAPGAYLRDVCDEVMRRHYRPRGREWDGRSRAGVTQVRGRRDRTCPVIVGGHTVIHPDLDRFLTVREAAYVMGFPVDYVFSRGSNGYKEVGRGLCTHNAAFLSRVVARGLSDGKPVDSADSTKLNVIDWRSKVSVPPMSSTIQDREAWWKERHPGLPVEWSHPRKKGKPGRPPGSRNRSSGSASTTTPRVLLVSMDEEDEKLFDELSTALEGMGLEVVVFGADEPDVDSSDDDEPELESQESDGPDLSKLAGEVTLHHVTVMSRSVDVNIVNFALGAAMTRGRKIAVMEAYDGPAEMHPFVQVLSGGPKKAAISVAQSAGVDPQTILAKMLEGKDAAAILAALL